MPLDADLLSQARTAEARVIDAEHDAEVARAEFGRAVRRLQLAGGSLREIAESAGGSRSWRKRRAGPGELVSCSFCGKHQKQIKKLIAGPGVYICNECIHRVHAVLAATGKTASTPIA